MEILTTLAQLKPDRPLPSNVEFYAGVIMETVGLPRSMFTPTFAVSRTIGWVMHALEQATSGKLIRPAARYTGEPHHQRLTTERDEVAETYSTNDARSTTPVASRLSITISELGGSPAGLSHPVPLAGVSQSGTIRIHVGGVTLPH